MYQNNEDTNMARENFDVVRSKVFKLHSSRPVLITKL